MNVLDRRRRRLIAGLTIMVGLTGIDKPAWACRDSSSPPKQNISERLKAVPSAFIGTVAKAGGDGPVAFDIEHLIQGRLETQKLSLRVGKSPCDIRFSVGQHWLYAGTTVSDPSRLLGGKTNASGAKLQRFDDSRLNFPGQWQRCDADAECKAVFYDCSVTAVNQRFLNEATQQAWRIGGDPKTLNCSDDNTASKMVFCRQAKCGAWIISQ